jgi:hypothetical protein
MTNSSSYAVPDDPADPEAAALELIVRLPADIMDTDAFTSVLQDFCGVLHVERAFARHVPLAHDGRTSRPSADAWGAVLCCRLLLGAHEVACTAIVW